MLCGELGYKPHEAYDLLACELNLILDGFYGRLKRERDGRAWLATHIEAVRRSDALLMPWELTGDEDPDEERRDRKRREQEEVARRLIGVPNKAAGNDETPEQVLARFGVLKQEDAHAG